MLRKAHIKRLFWVNASDQSQDKTRYLDLMRIEEFPFQRRSGAQDYTGKIDWEDGAGEDGNPDREITILKVTDPQNPPDDPNNPDGYIPVPLIKRMKIRDGDQDIFYCFVNDANDSDGSPLSTTRDVNPKRVKHAPTPNSDDTLNNGDIVDAEQYDRDETQVDDSQYVDQEVVKQFDASLRGAWKEDANRQDINSVMNATIFDTGGLFPQDPVPALNDDGSAPAAPLRLDPLESIVNCQLAQDIFQIIIDVSSSGDTTLLDTPNVHVQTFPARGAASMVANGDFDKVKFISEDDTSNTTTFDTRPVNFPHGSYVQVDLIRDSDGAIVEFPVCENALPTPPSPTWWGDGTFIAHQDARNACYIGIAGEEDSGYTANSNTVDVLANNFIATSTDQSIKYEWRTSRNKKDPTTATITVTISGNDDVNGFGASVTVSGFIAMGGDPPSSSLKNGSYVFQAKDNDGVLEITQQ